MLVCLIYIKESSFPKFSVYQQELYTRHIVFSVSLGATWASRIGEGNSFV